VGGRLALYKNSRKYGGPKRYKELKEGGRCVIGDTRRGPFCKAFVLKDF